MDEESRHPLSKAFDGIAHTGAFEDMNRRMAESLSSIVRTSMEPQLSALNDLATRIVEAQAHEVLAGFQPLFESLAAHVAGEITPTLDAIQRLLAEQLRVSVPTVRTTVTVWRPTVITESTPAAPIAPVDAVLVAVVLTMIGLTGLFGRALDAGEFEAAFMFWVAALTLLLSYEQHLRR